TASTLSFATTNVRTAGGVTLFDFTEHDALAGTFSGTTVIEGSCVVKQSGESVCHAFETLTGAVNGVSGTILFNDVIVIDPSGAVSGAFTIVQGTGGVADLHGHGEFTSAGGAGSYTAQLVFAPERQADVEGEHPQRLLPTAAASRTPAGPVTRSAWKRLM